MSGLIPYGRQHLPIRIVVTGKESEDVVFWVRHIKKMCEFKGDLVEHRSLRRYGSTELIVYPRQG